MSEWDFLWGLEGKELEDAMSSGMGPSDHDYIIDELQELTCKTEWKKLKLLRDSGAITMEDFKNRKRKLFPKQNIK